MYTLWSLDPFFILTWGSLNTMVKFCRRRKQFYSKFTGICSLGFNSQIITGSGNGLAVTIQWLINLVGGQLFDMACIVPMHVKPKFTYLLTWQWQGGKLWHEQMMTRVIDVYMNITTVFSGVGISIIKIRRSWDCLIFIMEIHILEIILIMRHAQASMNPHPRTGVGVTKALFINSSVSKIFNLAKVRVRFFKSHLYLTGIATA